MFAQQLYAVKCCEKYIICFDVAFGITSSTFTLGVSTTSCFLIDMVAIVTAERAAYSFIYYGNVILSVSYNVIVKVNTLVNNL